MTLLYISKKHSAAHINDDKITYLQDSCNLSELNCTVHQELQLILYIVMHHQGHFS